MVKDKMKKFMAKHGGKIAAGALAVTLGLGGFGIGRATAPKAEALEDNNNAIVEQLQEEKQQLQAQLNETLKDLESVKGAETFIQNVFELQDMLESSNFDSKARAEFHKNMSTVKDAIDKLNIAEEKQQMLADNLNAMEVEFALKNVRESIDNLKDAGHAVEIQGFERIDGTLQPLGKAIEFSNTYCVATKDGNNYNYALYAANNGNSDVTYADGVSFDAYGNVKGVQSFERVNETGVTGIDALVDFIEQEGNNISVKYTAKTDEYKISYDCREGLCLYQDSFDIDNNMLAKSTSKGSDEDYGFHYDSEYKFDSLTRSEYIEKYNSFKYILEQAEELYKNQQSEKE